MGRYSWAQNPSRVVLTLGPRATIELPVEGITVIAEHDDTGGSVVICNGKGFLVTEPARKVRNLVETRRRRSA
jgi:hypothetical protein